MKRELNHGEYNSASKRPRSNASDIIVSEDSNKIDPVEKLLSLTNINADFLTSLENVHEIEEEHSTNELTSLNFTKILNDTIRLYYATKRNNMAIYSDNFASLNKPPTNNETNNTVKPKVEVPFFKNVNFNSVSSLDEYLSYDEDEPKETAPTPEVSSPLSTEEDEEDPKSTVPAKVVRKGSKEVPQSPIFPNFKLDSKMSFRYRQNHNNLNLSHCHNDTQHDLSYVLNKHSIFTGRASEMVGNGGFLINDFFL